MVRYSILARQLVKIAGKNAVNGLFFTKKDICPVQVRCLGCFARGVNQQVIAVFYPSILRLSAQSPIAGLLM